MAETTKKKAAEQNAAAAEEIKAADKKKDRKKKAKTDKPGGGRISRFFKGLRSELKKIVWYGKEQTAKSTGLVLVSLVVFSAIISLLDLGFSSLIMWLGKLV